MLRNKIIRILEQPSIFKEKIHGIRPGHSRIFLTAQQLTGKEPKMFIDVGANIGEVVKACLFNFPNCEVHAFEPLKEHYQRLTKLGSNVKAYSIGLWNKSTTKTFYADKDKDGVDSSLLVPNGFVAEKRKIQLKRFDSLGIKIKRPCFVKIDVEGVEGKVLEGFGDTLRDIDVVQIEVMHKDFVKGRDKLSDIIKIFEKYGFNGFKQLNMTFSDGKPDKSDLMFFR